MRRNPTKILSLQSTVLVFLLCALSLVNAKPAVDLRILIDVSGSMKKNDPNNLRVPALRLLIQLLPPTAKAGIWTFDGKTTVHSNWGRTSRQWKDAALKSTHLIHSSGKLTNIENALDTVTKKWPIKGLDNNRHIILLSDGMVDVSKNSVDNSKSRNRILSGFIAKMQSANIKVHTIALSNNADIKLMQTVSLETNGTHIRIADTKSLHKVFLKLFESSTKLDKIPITNNQITVDKNISDMTILLFKTDSKQVRSIVSPAGVTLNFPSADKNVRWHQDKNYDLITITKPEPGLWKLNTQVDPDNRVIVVTDLKLQVSPLPDNILAGESVAIHARLISKKEKNLSKKLLQLTRFFVAFAKLGKQTIPRHENGDAIIKQLPIPGKPGTYTFQVSAKSASFERIQHHEITVHKKPLTVNVAKDPDKQQTTVEVTPTHGLFKTETLGVIMKFADGISRNFTIDPSRNHRLKVPKQYNGGEIEIELTGLRTNGSQYKYVLASQLPKYLPKALPEAVSKNTKHKEIITDAQPVTAPKKKRAKQPRHPRKAQVKSADTNWTLVIIIVFLINLIGASAFTYFFFLRNRNNNE